MTLSTTGAASDGLVYLTLTGVDASGRTIIEQGSGVLLSNDEVLTAAHLVYNSDGSLRTSGTASVGYNAGTSTGTAQVDGVQVGAKQDYTTLSGMGGDFAVVHLSTKLANGTVFSVGSDLTPGTFSVSGYPVGTAGALDTKSEALSVLAGTTVYAGESLHDGAGNPNGSSGGPIYRVENGSPTTYGVISADSATDVTKGYFKAFTASDVAQIRSWVAAADGTGVASSATSAAVASTSSTPAFSAGIAAMLSADAAEASGSRQVVMTDVASAIADACRQGGTLADMVAQAHADLAAGSSLPGKAVAYLAGLLSATTGATFAGIQRSANAMIAGAVTNAAQRTAAAAGRAEGLGMGVSNTSALITPAAAALAGVLADGGPQGDMGPVHDPHLTAGAATLAAGSLTDR